MLNIHYFPSVHFMTFMRLLKQLRQRNGNGNGNVSGIHIHIRVLISDSFLLSTSAAFPALIECNGVHVRAKKEEETHG